jgi:hypothetical protein
MVLDLSRITPREYYLEGHPWFHHPAENRNASFLAIPRKEIPESWLYYRGP